MYEGYHFWGMHFIWWIIWVGRNAVNKWYRNYIVANTIVEKLENLKMKYTK